MKMAYQYYSIVEQISTIKSDYIKTGIGLSTTLRNLMYLSTITTMSEQEHNNPYSNLKINMCTIQIKK